MREFRSLKDEYPELAKQWHPTKNGKLTPEQVSVCSNKKVWWLCSYDDPKTNKHFDFEWRSNVHNRVRMGLGCPYLSGQAVWPGYNDLATTHPHLVSEWHPTKNGNITPYNVTAGSTKVVYWIHPYDDPETGKHYDFEWKASVGNRALKNTGCPYLSGQAVWPGYNDLATTHPHLIKEWHPTKNGALTPDQVTAGSGRKAWWMLHYDDPETGKHHVFEWRATIVSRACGGRGCPYLSGRAVWPGYNDLATTHPHLVSEWHLTKNGTLTPDQVTAGSKRKAWWMLHYDDPETGKHHVFEWRATIVSRACGGSGCPYLSGQAVWPGYNDLATTYTHLIKEWHPTKNGVLTPDQVTAGSNRKVWWMLHYDDPETGKHHVFEWRATIVSRACGGNGCPYLSGQAVWPGYNDLATTHPHLVSEWHPTKNGALTPDQVTAGSNRKVWWMLHYDDPETGKHHVFEWRATIVSRACGERGCPYLSGDLVWPGYNDLSTREPRIAAELYDKKNHGIKANKICVNSPHKYWWKCSKCEYVWRTAVLSRTSRGSECPRCHRNKEYY